MVVYLKQRVAAYCLISGQWLQLLVYDVDVELNCCQADLMTGWLSCCVADAVHSTGPQALGGGAMTILQGGVAAAGTLWHGTARRTRRFMARPGTENHGTENLGTARHGKSWQGKILARHGPQKYQKFDFLGEEKCIGQKIRVFPKLFIPNFMGSH